MPQARFVMRISRDEYLRYYQGQANAVVATAVDGQRIRFPATALRPFVGHGGVSGVFVLVYDENNRFVELRRVGDIA